MLTEEIKQAKFKTLIDTCTRQKTNYVPNVLSAGGAILNYSGMTYPEIEHEPEKIEKALDNFFDKTWVDGSMIVLGAYPHSYKALSERCETFLAPDNVSLTHLQKDKMNEDEYPELIDNFDSFMSKTLLPRKYPELFSEGKEKAQIALKTVVEEQIYNLVTGPFAKIDSITKTKYGVTGMFTGMMYVLHPLDILFDDFRGFKGTITDLRRRPKQVKEACDMLYEKKCNHFTNISEPFPYAVAMPHIPAYLNAKQFCEYYFPYMQDMYTNIAKAQSKVVLSLQGRWMHILDCYLEFPKDSCVIMVDDDDVIEVKHTVGVNQIIGGGIKLQNIRLSSFDENKDYAKKIIDSCAPGGGFIFTSDKSCTCTGDINQNLIDIFNFAHEYTQN